MTWLALWLWAGLTTPAPPPLDDLARFPSADCCAGRLDFYRRRRAWLEGQCEVCADPYYAPWFDDALADVDARREAWETLAEARLWGGVAPAWIRYDRERGWHDDADTQYLHARRKLAELRRQLGDEAYRVGAMPGPMDFRFARQIP